MPDASARRPNTTHANMRDTVWTRKNPPGQAWRRPRGVTNHLDYIKQLGFNAIWMTPSWKMICHWKKDLLGRWSDTTWYWFYTDHYEIDKRMGGSAALSENLVKEAHARCFEDYSGCVYNHNRIYHWWCKICPISWINFWPKNTSSQGTGGIRYSSCIFPIYLRRIGTHGVAGLFPHLPDLNLRNSCSAISDSQSHLDDRTLTARGCVWIL